MVEYIYTITPKRAELATDPQAWTPEEVQIFERHFAYLKQATQNGVVILAGRSQDGVGPALVIFEADSDECAQRFMQNDPFIAEGLMTGSLHPYRVALSREPTEQTP